MGSCSECGQHVTTWNEQRERDVEDITIEQLLLSLDGEWRKVADNAVQLDLPDGYVVILVRPFIEG